MKIPIEEIFQTKTLSIERISIEKNLNDFLFLPSGNV